VARLKSRGVGAPDREALFASSKGAKRPEILATEAGSYKKSGSGSLSI